MCYHGLWSVSNSFKLFLSATSRHWGWVFCYVNRIFMMWQVLCPTILALLSMDVLPSSLHSSYLGLSHCYILAGPSGYCPAAVLHPPVGTLPFSLRIPPDLFSAWSGACNLCSPLSMVPSCRLNLCENNSSRTTCKPWPAIGSLLHQFLSCLTSANQCPWIPCFLQWTLVWLKMYASARHPNLLLNPVSLITSNILLLPIDYHKEENIIISRRQTSTLFSHWMPHVDSNVIKRCWCWLKSTHITFSDCNFRLLFFLVTVTFQTAWSPSLTTRSCILHAFFLLSHYWVTFTYPFLEISPSEYAIWKNGEWKHHFKLKRKN